jgi:hypothetical protein
MRSLDLPKGVGNVIVLADGDDGGEAAAHDCARRWKREGRQNPYCSRATRDGLQRHADGPLARN